MTAMHGKSIRRPSLMVTGASGALGRWICREAINKWSVYGIHWQHPIDIPGVKAVQADLTRVSELRKLLAVVKPAAVIHAAAVSQPAWCEADPETTHFINVRVPHRLAEICAGEGITFLYTSTDLVFNGLDAPYDELCTVSPVTVYGRQKAQAEKGILARYPGALVCRMPLMFGIGPGHTPNFTLQMLSAIQERKSIRLFKDEFRTPVDYQSAAQGLLNVLGRCRGFLHLGGRTRVSRFELGQLMARQMNSRASMLDPVSIASVSLTTARSPDCTLNSNNAYALGYDPTPLGEAVKRLVDQYSVISKG